MDENDERPFSPGEAYRADDGPRLHAYVSERGLQSINEIAREFDVTLRALQFYETKGFLKPQRDGPARRYGPAERRRLALLLKAKSLGFTLAEIRKMIGATAPGADAGALDINRRQCFEQIKLLEERKREIEAALAELRHLFLVLRPAHRHRPVRSLRFRWR
jgi:DNA-binding transcriptional MerR regulator